MFSTARTLLIALFSALLLAPALPGTAQVVATAPAAPVALADYNNRYDVFAGFSYARFNTTIGHSSRGNLMGFKVQGTVWVSPIFGLSAGTGNYYGTVSIPANGYGITTNPQVSEHLFLFGPEFRLLRDPKYTLDYHFLLGGTYGIFDTSFQNSGIQPSQLNLYNNQLAFAMATGAAFDYNLSPKWSGRMIVDFQPTHYGYAFQKDVSASVGLFYKWGEIKK